MHVSNSVNAPVHGYIAWLSSQNSGVIPNKWLWFFSIHNYAFSSTLEDYI